MIKKTSIQQAVLASTFGITAVMPVSISYAQAAYPDRPVTIVVPATPGGGGDFTARLVADDLSKHLGNTVIVENKPGAGGNIAASYVARAQPDGYTLLLAYSGTHVVNPALYDNLDWDPIKSFTPVARLITAPQVIVINNKVPATTLSEFIDYAKAHPGKVNFASSGNGSVQHVGTELLASRTDTQMVHVPYKGAGSALSDVISGQVQLLVTTPPAVASHIRAGNIRALAVSSKQRHPMLPEVPTTSEAGVKDAEVDAWFALYAPARTPRDVVDRLAQELEKTVTNPDFKRKAEDMGTYASFMGPDDLDTFTRSQSTYWAAIIHKLNIKIE